MFRVEEMIVEDRCIYYIVNVYDGYILWEGEDIRTAINKMKQFERKYNV